MAKINFGGVVQDARGKQNGLVYSKNKSGAYVRRKVTPANPQSPSQSAVRSNFGVLAAKWSGTLSDAQRAAWISYAGTYPRLDIFGASINITGLNMFISLNRILDQITAPEITTPPASNVINPIPFDPTSFSALVAGPAVKFQQIAAAVDVSDFFYVFGAKPLPPGRTVQKNDWRFLKSTPGVVGPYPAFIDVATEYVTKFGTFVAGQRISLLVATADQLTGLTTVGTTLTALAV